MTHDYASGELAVITITDYSTSEKVSKLHNPICRNAKDHTCRGYGVNLLKSSQVYQSQQQQQQWSVNYEFFSGILIVTCC